MPVELSFCVVNTEQRPLLRYCLDAIARERATVDFETEVLVLDNASRDGSAGMARAHPVTTELIRREQRRGKAENDSALMQRARGRFCLLLNEDSELLPGATDTAIWDQFWPQAPHEKMVSAATVAEAVAHAVMLPANTSIEEIRIGPTGGEL